MAVIGLDFGNFNSYTSFIQDLDYNAGRLGGRAAELMPAGEFRDGIPSVFFYKPGDAKPLVCQNAVKAKPITNQVRYLKRGLFTPLVIDGQRIRIGGKDWLFDDAIREVVQDVLRQANDALYTDFRQTTNLVSLAYPVTYSPPQIQRLIEIVESATVEIRAEDGSVHQERVKVFGTIPEPAAAALDYLAEHESDRKKEEVTAATFDLGGGTFDAAVVRCYPGGKKRDDGSTYYYDLLWQGGLPDLGGKEFTEVVAEIAEKKLRSRRVTLTEMQKERLHRERAERAKLELSRSESTEIEVKDDVYVEISRKEFEQASRPLVQRMVEVLGQAMNSEEFRPDLVLLSGGASRMPMIESSLKEAFKDWRDRIHAYRPEQAISFGAARYGATTPSKPVQKRTAFELGLECRHSDTLKSYVSRLIGEGTAIPCSSNWRTFLTVSDNSEYVAMIIQEAVSHEADREDLGHFRKIVSCNLPFRRRVPAGTPIQGRLSIDDRGVMKLEAREKEGDKPVTVEGRPTLV